MSEHTALMLAAPCDGITFHEEYEDELAKDAAAELRRLHEENQKQSDLLREIVAYCREHGHDWLNLAEAEAALAKAQGENNG